MLVQSRSGGQQGFHGPWEAGASLCCWQQASSLQELCSQQGRHNLMVAPRWDPWRQQCAVVAATPGTAGSRPVPARAVCAQELCPLSQARDTWLSLASSFFITAGLPGCMGRAVKHMGTRWQK